MLKTSTEISIHAPQWGATRRDDPACRRHANFNPRTPVGCDQTCAQHGHARHGFQSTHPSGVRPLRIMLRICALLFQSTHPSGVRPHIAMSYGLFHVFQSTHPSGVRRIIVIPQDRFGIFQSTHPSGVRLIDNDDRYHTYLFQSTHPSGVRRSPTANPCTRIRISIHAPQWGATKFKVRLTITPEISIHAPQWGATLAEGVKTGAGARFQSTHPSGVRLASRGELRFARFEFQSTHPSGVRLSVISVSWAATYFNPRTPVGCDDSAPILGPPFMVFQSTHPSGVRRCALGSRRCPLTISIHAPQWGATWHTSIQCRQPPISIHAPQWGATCSDLQ